MAADQLADAPERILQAAFRRLHEIGYARLSTRDIAAEAGVNHALIHYYFGTKDRLVIAALDEANQSLLERQRQMYDAPGDCADKWAQAMQFYEEDLASGFVRVQMELLAASLSNAALREEFIPRFMAWRKTVEDAVRAALAHYGLALSISPEAIACWIVDFWAGMEFERLLGMSEREAHHREAMDAMLHLLRQLDERATSRGSAAVVEASDSSKSKGERMRNV